MTKVSTAISGYGSHALFRYMQATVFCGFFAFMELPQQAQTGLNVGRGHLMIHTVDL